MRSTQILTGSTATDDKGAGRPLWKIVPQSPYTLLQNQEISWKLLPVVEEGAIVNLNKYRSAPASVFHNLDSRRVCFSALLKQPSGRRWFPPNPPPEPFGLLHFNPHWVSRNPKLRFGLATESGFLGEKRVVIRGKNQ